MPVADLGAVVVNNRRVCFAPSLLLEADAGVDSGTLFLPEMHVALRRRVLRLGEAQLLPLHVPYRVVGCKEHLLPCAQRALGWGAQGWGRT